MVFNDHDDPLTILMAPPPDETPEQKIARERQELEARRVSDKIDEGLKAERAAKKKEKYIVKVLLLGQSESGKLSAPLPDEMFQRVAGKSTTLKSNISLSIATHLCQ